MSILFLHLKQPRLGNQSGLLFGMQAEKSGGDKVTDGKYPCSNKALQNSTDLSQIRRTLLQNTVDSIG